ncbi:MAG: carbohydrate binding domain-containing protein [Phycisphaerales bacterium]
MRIQGLIVRICCLSAVLLAVHPIMGQTTPDENMLKNPGFENGPVGSPNYHWSLNNWAKNEVEAALDETNPHSGKFCQRVTMKKIVKEPDVQLISQMLPLKPNMTVELRFWMRGNASEKPIMVQFRKYPAPYTTYWKAMISLTPEWKEYVFRMPLPAALDPEHTGLMFDLQDENTFWLDDVSVKQVPAE